jgi:hypothetical protein
VLENGDRATAHVEASLASTTSRRPPIFVPSGQLYFWTREWQNGEAEALREIENGEARRFPNGKAAADWILSDDED